MFATWWFCKEMKVLFDCGDGASSGLLQQARKIKHVFVSHPDRDHIAGLLQFNQLNARPGLRIYYPSDSGSFPALAEFSSKFDQDVSGTQWIPIEHGSEIQLRDDLVIRAMRNEHIPAPQDQAKSLSFVAESISRKLKPEIEGKPSKEIAALRKAGGDEAISEVTRKTKLIYSGDTPITDDGRYNDAEVLIHEATFLTNAELDPTNPRRIKHSTLEQIMELVSRSNIGTLVLGHFSSRYSHQQIDEAIEKERLKLGLEIPIYRVLPGETRYDIMGK